MQLQNLTKEELIDLRAQIEGENAELKYMRRKKADRLKQVEEQAEDLRKELQELDRKVNYNNDKYFDAGTALEKATGQKRI